MSYSDIFDPTAYRPQPGDTMGTPPNNQNPPTSSNQVILPQQETFVAKAEVSNNEIPVNIVINLEIKVKYTHG